MRMMFDFFHFDNEKNIEAHILAFPFSNLHNDIKLANCTTAKRASRLAFQYALRNTVDCVNEPEKKTFC